MANNKGVVTVKTQSATNQAQANFRARQMYKSMTFVAVGTVRIRGDERFRQLSNCYLAGLGQLWSGTYAILEATHTISSDGYECEGTVSANAIQGSLHAEKAAQKAHTDSVPASPGTTTEYVFNGATGDPVATQVPNTPDDDGSGGDVNLSGVGN